MKIGQQLRKLLAFEGLEFPHASRHLSDIITTQIKYANIK